MTQKSIHDQALTDVVNKRWAADLTKAVGVNTRPTLTIPNNRTNNIPSRDTWMNGDTAKRPSPVYTGDKCIGVVVQHKSCLQPIFSKEEAEDSAKMRR